MAEIRGSPVGSIYLIISRILYIPGPMWLFGISSTVTVSFDKIFTLYTHDLWVILLVSTTDNDQILHQKTDIFKKNDKDMFMTFLDLRVSVPFTTRIQKKNMDVKIQPPTEHLACFFCWISPRSGSACGYENEGLKVTRA